MSSNLDIRFPGFRAEAFEILGRLRAHPHAEQYRQEKDGVRTEIMDPFKQFRDDVVVNFVLPNRLNLETERNVFSRLLKNDFGAGGCHSHVWMSFYRPDRSRLSDLQPFHGIDPDGFSSGLHAGGRDPKIVQAACEAFRRRPEEMLGRINPLLASGGWTLSFAKGSGARKLDFESEDPLEILPDLATSADGMALYRTWPRESAVAMGGGLADAAVGAMAAIWPIYEEFARDS